MISRAAAAAPSTTASSPHARRLAPAVLFAATIVLTGILLARRRARDG